MNWKKQHHTAALMSRVSSDDQAKGYSLGVQKGNLEKYCLQNELEVVYHIKEDFSAKTFNRPAFNQFLEFAKKNRGKIDLLLFTSWDRFARNVTDAYVMIRRLKGLGIEPRAIEQPVDVSIPENKLFLAFYLSIPEIENDRRSIKIRGGMRAALKAGRWCRSAPCGYENSRDENNQPVIIQNKNAGLIKKSFSQVSKGKAQTEVLHFLTREGLRLSKNGLSRLLRNPMYMGKIVVPEFDDEEETMVDGLHEAIVSESLFYRVQNKLRQGAIATRPDSNRKVREEFYLRGLLVCQQCGMKLTGSASRSKTGKRHYYYHCTKGCPERQRAFEVNDRVRSFFSELKFDDSIVKLHSSLLHDHLKDSHADDEAKLKLTKKGLAELDDKHKIIQDHLMADRIAVQDYTEMRSRIEQQRSNLSDQLSKIEKGSKTQSKKLNEAIEFLFKSGEYFNLADPTQKQSLVSSIFPEKLVYDGKKVRTPRINEVLQLMLLKTRKQRNKKKGQLFGNLELSPWVEPAGQSSNFLKDDIERIVGLGI